MYHELKQRFARSFGKDASHIFSAPGRTELGGNHTDHQLGRVLAAAVNLESCAAVALNGERCVRLLSDGYPRCEITLDELAVRPEETGTSAALIRGVLAGIRQRGGETPGFDAYVCSEVLPGSGLSSSASFEVLMGVIASTLSGCALSPLEIARLGQYAENVYFGKPCGLMDQAACAVGGVVAIDFAEQDAPRLERLELDLGALGYALCIIDSGADHADLTAEYAAIPAELAAVCRVFGQTHLRRVDEAEFYRRLPEVRAAAGDRATLRAMHIFADNRRVDRQVEALKAGDFARFLALATASGRSSWMYLQNVIPQGAARRQELALSLALAEKLLDGRGAFRVQGGGFAGTIQAFVPLDMLEGFRAGIEQVLGAGSCHVLNFRPQGGVLVEEA